LYSKKAKGEWRLSHLATQGIKMEKLNARLVALEEQFTHQQRTIDALNQVILQQQKMIDRFEAELGRAEQKMESLMSARDETPRTLEDDRPPHY
jgi:uncharacterized coiled-coil protein SlyX